MNKQQYPRRNASQWQEIISTQEASGESVSAYCRHQNLCDKSFYSWRRRLRKRTGPRLKDFVKITVPAKSNRESLQITTPEGYSLKVPEGMDGAFVKNIIAALGSI